MLWTLLKIQPKMLDVGSPELTLSANEVEEWLNSDKNLTEELITKELVELVDGQSDIDTSDDKQRQPNIRLLLTLLVCASST